MPVVSYRQKALTGFGSQTVLKILSNGATLVKMMVLARLLTPEQFGVFSLVMIAVGVSESVTQTGVNLTILQSRQPMTYFLNTAWVIAIFRGFLISLVMIALGYGMSLFFDNPELLFLIAWASLIPAVKGFINPAIVSLHKELKFWSDGLYRFALVAVETVLIVGLIWWSKSVGMWITSLILAAVVEVVISFVFFRHRPRFIYTPPVAKVIFGQAKWLSINSLVQYLTENLDNLLVGKLLGTYALGIYQNSYSLSHEVNYELAKSAHHGTLPIYTQLTGEKARLRRAVMKTMISTGLLMTVTSLPLLLFGEWLIPFLFSAKWEPVVAILPWMVLAGMLQAMTMLSHTVLYACRRVKVINQHLFANLVGMVVLFWWWGQGWGLIGVAVALVISRLVTLPWLLWAVIKEVRSYA